METQRKSQIISTLAVGVPETRGIWKWEVEMEIKLEVKMEAKMDAPILQPNYMGAQAPRYM